jgi:hypothetical protein
MYILLSASIIRSIKSRMMRGAVHVSRMGRREMRTGVFHFVDLGTGGSVQY